jgi:hypothetical protein
MVYRHAPGINTSSKDPTSLVSAEAIPVLYLISLVGTWGNISLVYLVPVSYQSQYQTCLPPVKNQSWAQHQDQTVCVFFFFFGSTTPDLTWQAVGTSKSSPMEGQQEFHLHTTEFEPRTFCDSRVPEGAIAVTHHPFGGADCFSKAPNTSTSWSMREIKSPDTRTRLQQVCSKVNTRPTLVSFVRLRSFQ